MNARIIFRYSCELLNNLMNIHCTCSCTNHSYLIFPLQYLDLFHFLLHLVPLNTILMKMIGVRKISALGTVLTLIGVLPSAFATEVWHAVISYGVIASKYDRFIYILIYEIGP